MRPVLIVLMFVLALSSSLPAQTSTAPSTGDGTSGSPYQIASADNLYWLTLNAAEWDKYFVQTANISASGAGAWASGGAGFSPIGNSSTQFTGSYNGQNFTVDVVTCNRSTVGNQGMFGWVDGGTIQNLNVTNAEIIGTYGCGALVGEIRGGGTISDCSATGTVTGTYYVGGLLGAIGTYGNPPTLTRATCNSTVIGVQYVGALVGVADDESNISECSAFGSVTCQDNGGGFCGTAWSGTISDSYCRADVSRTSGASGSYFGGFCGYLSSTITSCYSTGSVTYLSGTSPTAYGFLPINYGTCTNNYFDTETSGQSSGAGATGKTTAQMKTAATFVGMAASTWNIDGGINDGYPHLDWENPSGTPLPVQMAPIDAFSSGGSVTLRWVTITEVDNAGFDVERRNVSAVGGQRSEWMKVGYVEGSGTSTSPHSYEFTDENVPPGRHEYRLRQIDRTGSSAYQNGPVIEVNPVPSTFALEQNYPNPFNPSTTIRFGLPLESHVRIEVINAIGQVVGEIADGVFPAGYSQAVWNANVPSGLYIYRITAAAVANPDQKFAQIRKMVLLR